MKEKIRFYVLVIQDSKRLSYEELYKKLKRNKIHIVGCGEDYYIEIKSFDDIDNLTKITRSAIQIKNDCIVILNNEEK